MLDDQQIRRQLVDYADGVGVDVDGDLARVLDASGERSGRARRIALLTAVPLIVVLLVGGILVATGALGERGSDRPAGEVTGSRLTGTWMRTLTAPEGLPASAEGSWVMVLDSDGAMTLVPPEAWAAENFQPNGVYVRSGDGFRTNVFAAESCAGASGEYSFTVDHATLDVSATIDPCALRVAVLEGRWERAP